MTSEADSAPPEPTQSEREHHIELLLDRALEATFPASDPVALTLGGYPAVATTAGAPARRGQP